MPWIRLSSWTHSVTRVEKYGASFTRKNSNSPEFRGLVALCSREAKVYKWGIFLHPDLPSSVFIIYTLSSSHHTYLFFQVSLIACVLRTAVQLFLPPVPVGLYSLRLILHLLAPGHSGMYSSWIPRAPQSLVKLQVSGLPRSCYSFSRSTSALHTRFRISPQKPIASMQNISKNPGFKEENKSVAADCSKPLEILVPYTPPIHSHPLTDAKCSANSGTPQLTFRSRAQAPKPTPRSAAAQRSMTLPLFPLTDRGQRCGKRGSTVV